MQILMDHAWPGNVRELENVVERAVVLASQPSVPVDVLPEHLLEARGLRIRRDESGRLAADASLFEIVADFERRKIIEQLEDLRLEPDGRGRGAAHSALDAESEDQAPEHRDPQAFRRIASRDHANRAATKGSGLHECVVQCFA